MAQLHGGNLSVRSAGVGQGSEFLLRLPIVTAKPTEGPAAAPAFSAVPVPPARVLVVDDNRGAAVLLQRLLENYWQHEVTLAFDGEQALTAAEQLQPHLILLDIGLPKLDGYEVARRLRERPEFSQTRIVAVTGYGSESDRQRSHAAGIDEHLVKPVSVQALQQVFSTAMRSVGQCFSLP